MSKKVAIRIYYDREYGELAGFEEAKGFESEDDLMKADIYNDILNGALEDDLYEKHNEAFGEFYFRFVAYRNEIQQDQMYEKMY